MVEESFTSGPDRVCDLQSPEIFRLYRPPLILLELPPPPPLFFLVLESYSLRQTLRRFPIIGGASLGL